MEQYFWDISKSKTSVVRILTRIHQVNQNQVWQINVLIPKGPNSTSKTSQTISNGPLATRWETLPPPLILIANLLTVTGSNEVAM